MYKYIYISISMYVYIYRYIYIDKYTYHIQVSYNFTISSFSLSLNPATFVRGSFQVPTARRAYATRRAASPTEIPRDPTDVSGDTL